MQLTDDRLAHLRRSLESALDQEWPRLSVTHKSLRRLSPVVIVKRPENRNPLPIIATVATDGGENRLNLEPLQLQVVRVADSSGAIYFEEFVAQSLTANEILETFFHSNPRLQRFLNTLDLDWKELLPRSDFQKSQLLSMLRELMEWAALLELAGQPPARLLIRDGLLRSILLSAEVFQRLLEEFKRLTTRHGHLLVGVAKRSRVTNYLSLVLDLDESFRSGEPAYLAIPPDLECEAAPFQYRWIGSRA
ncbi:MAG TPA: DNA double-strand break repair nuclease NurA, partial [Clostridia bacterium]|nr:DNA double-strand break repair nuclease NurA [Clostridia bacterium]